MAGNRFQEYGSQALLIGVFVIILAVLVIGINALRTTEISSVTDSTESNESLTLANATAVSLSRAYVTGVTTLWVNYSGSWTALDTSNYTVGNANTEFVGTVTLIDNTYNGNASLATYTYKDLQSKVSLNITEQGRAGVRNATSYLGTTGTMIGVGLILLVVILAFGLLRR